MDNFEETRVSLLLLFENDTSIQPSAIMYDCYDYRIINLHYKFPDWRYGVHFAFYDYYNGLWNDNFEDSYDKWIAKYCEFNEYDNEYEYNMDLDEFYNFKSNKKEIPFVSTTIGNIYSNVKLSELDAHNIM